MIRKLSEYIGMFEEEDKVLKINVQIKEHIVLLNSSAQGYDILYDLLINISFELLRYSEDDDKITLSLKY